MNIIFLCDQYPPGQSGGIGSTLQSLGRELVKKGHNIYVIGLYSYRYGQSDYEIDNGVHVYRLRYGIKLPVRPESKYYGLIERLPSFIKNRINGQRAFNKFIHFITDFIKHKNIDLIEVPDWNAYIIKAGIKAYWPKLDIPLIVKSHGSKSKLIYDSNLKPDPYFYNIDNTLFKRADYLSAVSQDTADVNKKIFQLVKDVTILYNGIELKEKILTPREVINPAKVVFSSNYLLPMKGIYSILDTWNILVQELENVELHIYGSGNYRALQGRLTNDAAQKVFFKGRVSRSELIDAFKNATIAVFPSYSECFAMAPLEAMSVGCPIINTIKSSGGELVQSGYNGELVDPDNIQDFSEKIKTLLQNPELRKKYSINGIVTIKDKFTVEKSVKDHLDFYTFVIEDFRYGKN